MQDSQKTKIRGITISLLLSILLMAIKFGAYFITHSNAILSDALESIINVMASGFALYSIYLSSQPRDREHPYGHGKIEYFSSGFEGGLIIIAGILIVVEALRRLWYPQPVENLDWGLWLIMVTVIINGVLGYYLIKTGRKTRSEALIADGQHLLTDSLSSVIVLVGLGLLWFTGLYWIDSIASLVLSAFIFYNGFKLIRRSVGALMDESDPQLLNEVIEILNSHKRPEWIDVHNMRIQKYGSDLHVDCHLTLPYYWDLQQVHESIHAFEEILDAKTTGNFEIFIHADPCLPDCCKYCRMSDCPVRSAVFKEDIQWSADNLAKNQKHFVEEV
ncbi:MAG: cation diffusion facilitator family transporter [Runella sp.]